MAMKMPSTVRSLTAPVLRFFSRAWVTLSGFSAPRTSSSARIPDHLDLRVLEQPVLQDLLGAQAVAPVHQRDLGGEIGQEQRFLDRGIAAADHQHFFAAIEEAVAGGAGGHAIAAEFLLRRQIEPARLRAGGEDERLGDIDLAGIAFDAERPPRQIDLVDMVGDHLGADMGGLLLHLLHEPRALDHVGEARIVLDVGGGGELAAGLHALDHDRDRAWRAPHRSPPCSRQVPSR